MKIRLMTIILMVLCLAISTQLVMLCSGSGGAQNVGGDFGRAWLSNYLAQNPRPAAPGNNSTASNNTTADWGGSPKGTTDLSSNLVKPQNTTVTNTDWLGSSTITGDQTSPVNTSKNGAAQQQTYFASGTISPIHQIDASFNQSAVNPQPDSNGMIDGYPAESYYSIGPALFNF
ncbi:MAG: hypothetical protein WB392_08655 [Methanotrichaceae archaeon]